MGGHDHGAARRSATDSATDRRHGRRIGRPNRSTIRRETPKTRPRWSSTTSRRSRRERDDYLATLRRVQADFENYRKRVHQGADRARRAGERGPRREAAAGARLVRAALASVPPTRRRRRELRKGIELLHAELVGVLEKSGLARIEADGTPFDPNEHEAVMQEDGDGEPVVAEHAAHRVHAEGQGAAAGDGEGRAVARAGLTWRRNASGSRPTTTRCSACQGRDREGHHARLPQARQAAPPRREPGRRPGRGAVQGDLGRVRRARRRRQAQGVRRGPRDGRVGRDARRLRRRRLPGGGAGGFEGFQSFQFDEGAGLGDLLGGLFGAGPAAGGARGGAGPRRAGPGPAPTSRPSSTSTSSTRSTASPPASASPPTRCARCATAPGRKPGTAPDVCPDCGGTGEILVDQGPFSFSQVCPTCGGRGTIVKDPCPNCGGRGVERRRREVKVRIPPGVDDGQRIRVKGRGAAGRARRPAGRPLRGRARRAPPGVRALGQAQPHACACPITFVEAALGAQVKVPDAGRAGHGEGAGRHRRAARP